MPYTVVRTSLVYGAQHSTHTVTFCWNDPETRRSLAPADGTSPPWEAVFAQREQEREPNCMRAWLVVHKCSLHSRCSIHPMVKEETSFLLFLRSTPRFAQT